VQRIKERARDLFPEALFVTEVGDELARPRGWGRLSRV
jgi:hypothetical protein